MVLFRPLNNKVIFCLLTSAQVQPADVTVLCESADYFILLQPHVSSQQYPVHPSVPLHDWKRKENNKSS